MVALAIVCALIGSGCSSVGPYMSNNVSMNYQRQQIERFDPLPDQDIAPPVVGGRPREFDQPPPQGERAFWSAQPRRPGWGF